MHVFDEMKAYIGFDDHDEATLRHFWVVARPHVKRIIDHFYERILATPDARAVLQDEAQVERLKLTLMRWLQELLFGPHDLAYYERRQRIGRVHVDVGLPHRFMFTAMAVMVEDCCEVANDELPQAQARVVCRAIRRAAELDLAIMTGTYLDQREQRQLHALQELIVSHMPVTILLVDSAGRVTSATRPGTRLVERREIVGRHYTEAIPTALVVAADLENQVRRAIETRREIALMRIDAVIDHDERSFRITIVPLDHDQASVLLHFDDLSEAVQTEARLRRSESLAQLGSMSAAVAHELRNPLAGISGAIQVITRSLPEDDRRRPVMNKVEGQINRLNHVVTDLLAFARSQPVRLDDVSLLEIAASVRDLVTSENPDLVVRLTGSGDARADGNRVHQVLLNLVQNASQANDRGGEVLIAIDGPSILINDGGPGIPEDLRARIFEPFFTTRMRGTGLGLAICRKSAAEMGARLSLDMGEHPLGGAAFLLELQPVR